MSLENCHAASLASAQIGHLPQGIAAKRKSMPQEIDDAQVIEVAKQINAAFDKRFLESLKNEDPISSILKTHMIIERELLSWIEIRLFQPDALKEQLNARLGYEVLVRLAVALGLKKTLMNPLLKLGAMRNKVAHNYDFVLSSDVITQFRTTFSAELLKELEQLYKKFCKNFKMKYGGFKKAEAKYQFILSMFVLYKNLSFWVNLEKIIQKRYNFGERQNSLIKRVLYTTD